MYDGNFCTMLKIRFSIDNTKSRTYNFLKRNFILYLELFELSYGTYSCTYLELNKLVLVVVVFHTRIVPELFFVSMYSTGSQSVLFPNGIMKDVLMEIIMYLPCVVPKLSMNIIFPLSNNYECDYNTVRYGTVQ